MLPVFYYNDMLLSSVGDTIGLSAHLPSEIASKIANLCHFMFIGFGQGLNLFEPRYLLMCQRLTLHPRFLFMSNYEDLYGIALHNPRWLCRALRGLFLISDVDMTLEYLHSRYTFII